MRVPEAIFIEVIVGGVTSVGTTFPKVTYERSAILKVKSHVVFPVLYVPVYTVAQVAKVVSVSRSNIRVPVNHHGTLALG